MGVSKSQGALINIDPNSRALVLRTPTGGPIIDRNNHIRDGSKFLEPGPPICLKQLTIYPLFWDKGHYLGSLEV